MKKMRKTIALIMAIMLLAGITAFSAAAEAGESAKPPIAAPADPGTIKVSLRIEGVKENMYYNKSIEIASGSTVADLMTQVNELDKNISIVVKEISGDSYISKIGDLAESDYGGYSGWSFRVNEFAPVVGQSLVKLEDGDVVVYYYGDPWGEPGMQYPVPDITRLYSAGIIKFMSNDVVYDEEWNKSEKVNPVVGATVTFNKNTYTTDENGEIIITDLSGVSGMQSMQIEKYDEASGVPMVLRYAPDFRKYIPFADTSEDGWYKEAVEFCVDNGYFKGTNAAKNLFAPKNSMTLAQLVTVLSRIAGEDVDAVVTPWYKTALDWALKNNIIEEDTFEAGASVTRETFIYMFYLTAALAGNYDMTVSADITTATDYADIKEDYREAISWAVASGIIRGTSSAALTIAPAVKINRATVCQMLLNYYGD